MASGVARPTRLRTGPYAVDAELVAEGMPGPLWVGTAHDGVRKGEPLLVRRMAGGSEAQAALRASGRWATELDHPSLITVVDVRTAGDEVLLFSAFEEEIPLEEALRLAAVRRRPIPPAIVARVLIDLCEAGTHLRDLRRQGEVVLASYRPDVVWLGRHGRARLLEPTVQDLVTRSEPWSRDPKRARYDAPERFDGVYAHPSDIWSLGVLAWEMLCNRPLFVGADHATVAERVVTTRVRRADAFTPAGGTPIDSALADAIETCLSIRASERFEDFEALSAALRALDPASRRESRRFFDDLCAEVIVRQRRKVDVAVPGYAGVASVSEPPSEPAPSSSRRPRILPSSRPPRRSSGPPRKREPSSDLEEATPEVRIPPLHPPVFDVEITEKLAVTPQVDERAIEVVMPVEVGSHDRRVEVEVEDVPPPAPSSAVGGLPEAWDPEMPALEAPLAEEVEPATDSQANPPPLSIPPPPPKKVGVGPGVWLVVVGMAVAAGGALFLGGEGGTPPSPVPATSSSPAPPPPVASNAARPALGPVPVPTDSMDETAAGGHDGEAVPEASSAAPESKPPPLPPRPYRPRPRPKYIPGGI